MHDHGQVHFVNQLIGKFQVNRIYPSSPAETLTRKHLASGRCLLVDLVEEAARRWEPAEENRQVDEREHEQDTNGQQTPARVSKEEEGKRRHALADEYEPQ